ncbi:MULTISPECIES: hypothetical protein [unclassified Streptomyces]|uniref:hypothetical protein n=1 Tax=unclassified Streptomyces TaxID=2593676 RepID=UPI0020240153|nr:MULTISPECIES: hypothetical protein [unclassified Streptomyces]MCX4550530.1 hypothetical protein [Streptomyces sp. NBC_01500]WSC21977.1 hypothetical protein OIE60_21115 [Streptomyces sp. NBC_01766]
MKSSYGLTRAATITAGAGATALGAQHDDAITTTTGMALVLCGILWAALSIVRGWMVEFGQGQRQALAQQQWVAHFHTGNLVARLDETIDCLAAERMVSESLRRELHEMTEEYNLLVQETLQSRNDLFTRHTSGGMTLPSAAHPMRLTLLPNQSQPHVADQAKP